MPFPFSLPNPELFQGLGRVGAASTPRIINAQDLFRGDREVWIEHGGVRYRLRLTRRNKLILQK